MKGIKGFLYRNEGVLSAFMTAVIIVGSAYLIAFGVWAMIGHITYRLDDQQIIQVEVLRVMESEKGFGKHYSIRVQEKDGYREYSAEISKKQYQEIEAGDIVDFEIIKYHNAWSRLEKEYSLVNYD